MCKGLLLSKFCFLKFLHNIPMVCNSCLKYTKILLLVKAHTFVIYKKWSNDRVLIISFCNQGIFSYMKVWSYGEMKKIF